MNSKLIMGAVVGLVIGGSIGYFIPHGASASAKANFAGGQFAGRTGAMRGSGAVVGQIIDASNGTLTVKMQDGSTKLVLVSTSTQIMKATAGALSDLSVGTEIFVQGNANGDGSVTASSVQLRPAGSGNAPMMRAQ